MPNASDLKYIPISVVDTEFAAWVTRSFTIKLDEVQTAIAYAAWVASSFVTEKYLQQEVR